MPYEKNGGIDMLEMRQRQEKKHFVSDNELAAFAWAGYYTNNADVFVNGKEYYVAHVVDVQITFEDDSFLPYGCYAIFKEKSGHTFFYNETTLEETRKAYPLEGYIFCLNDKSFMRCIQN
jgi:hypothetical protein